MDKQQKIARDYWDEFSKRNSVALKKIQQEMSSGIQ